VSEAVTRIRFTRAAWPALVVLAICVVPLAGASPWLSVLYVLPIAVGAWVQRAGVDVDAGGLTVRALLRSRRIGWAEVAGLRPGPRGELRVVLASGRQVRLPVARLRDLPVIAAASRGRIASPGEAPWAAPPPEGAPAPDGAQPPEQAQ
jgi:Bacterial PH domain